MAASKDPQLLWKIHSVSSVQCSTGPYTLRCHTNLIDIVLNEQYQFLLTERLQSDPVMRRLGQYCQMSDGLFQYLPRATSKNIENHEPGERMIWHQSICQNSKHSREAENSVLLDAKSFLGDIDSINLNETSTNVSDHLAGYSCHKKLKLYNECCDQLLLSGEPNSACIGIFSTGGLKNR